MPIAGALTVKYSRAALSPHPQQRNLDRHIARFRELYGVAEQVEQDLAQPCWIAAIGCARLARDVQRHIDMLFQRLGGHQRDGALDCRFKVESCFRFPVCRLPAWRRPGCR